MSKDLEAWLIKQIKVPKNKITQVYNGVDINRFMFDSAKPLALLPIEFRTPGLFLIGTVGRLDPVKDQTTLVQAFISFVRSNAELSRKVRLVIVGEGILMLSLQRLVRDADIEHLVWFAGERHDIADIMQTLDLFVLPSINEGISNTLLEAMASALPVIATKVGGSPELVVEGQTGYLVPKQDPLAMSVTFKRYLLEPELLKRHGLAGRARVVSMFSLNRMMADYMAIYDKLLAERVLN